MNHIYLDSAHSDTPSKPHDTSWNLAIGNVAYRPETIQLRDMRFVNLAGAFPDGSNQFLVRDTIGPNDYTVTIPQGGYTGDELAAYLAAELLTLTGVVWTITFDETVYKFTFEPASGSWSLLEGDENAWEQLGFVTIPQAFTTTVTSEQIVRLDGPQYIDVLCDLHSTLGNYVDSVRHSIIARVPLDLGYGGVIFYHPEMDDSMFLTAPLANTKIHLRLVKPDGTAMELPESCPVDYHFVAHH